MWWCYVGKETRLNFGGQKGEIMRHRGGFRGGRGGRASSLFFAITCCFFCNHFEELQTVSFEVELIIDNALLAYVYPNIIKTCLTPNHLLFCRQLLYYSNATSNVGRNLTSPASTTDTIYNISNHFCDRWRHEFLVNLRETQRTPKFNINSKKLMLC